ncbi:preprotein translocase subunit YajC [Kyrpidia spormannii]|uniref:Component of the preprotein translocase (Holotranslocon) n=3 Tax=Kyrpidia TaxID=1129704 RepID=A0A2K8N9X8_9BACL|nr:MULTISPECIES: preprotein translocase subunit YajC [Kyrpidia]HHY65583.1 preprotein translocase subunit YajC [Alicyclobacillus sp.]ADG05727.1 preprotein translocase, YajC subunit [Kyrpidia tusciae DSM 2912]ATY85420.1 preprotein translocase subunit YajC [Kyrpidia spormannii]MBE3552088.1 preprotein translocase subunit YajC [Kyrpidia tusciae]MCL6575410.1 preprotein translocase subunit YajC [Kyrpidia sp.]
MQWQNYSGILSIIVMFAIFYFLLIRPQQKRQKERQAMLSKLQKGDKVVTIGGIHGTVVDLTDDQVTLRVAETTKIVFERSAISSVIKDS